MPSDPRNEIFFPISQLILSDCSSNVNSFQGDDVYIQPEKVNISGLYLNTHSFSLFVGTCQCVFAKYLEIKSIFK